MPGVTPGCLSPGGTAHLPRGWGEHGQRCLSGSCLALRPSVNMGEGIIGSGRRRRRALCVLGPAATALPARALTPTPTPASLGEAQPPFSPGNAPDQAQFQPQSRSQSPAPPWGHPPTEVPPENGIQSLDAPEEGCTTGIPAGNGGSAPPGCWQSPTPGRGGKTGRHLRGIS